LVDFIGLGAVHGGGEAEEQLFQGWDTFIFDDTGVAGNAAEIGRFLDGKYISHDPKLGCFL
jgi:hypothetical protein